MNEGNELDQKLSELARATERVRARPGFTERVMAAAMSRAMPSFEDLLMKSVKRAFPALLMAAILSLSWAAVNESSADAAFAAADDSVEIDW